MAAIDDAKVMKENEKDGRDTKELEPIISYQLTERLQTEFKEFGYIRVYGTDQDPLFPAIDAAKAIGLKRFRLEDHALILGKHYHRRVIPGIHSRDIILLTERGLYTVISKSNSKFSEKFMDFISIILKELRTKGVVTLTDAVDKLRIETQSLAKQLDENHKQLDEKHKQFVEQKRDAERYYMQSYALSDEKEKLHVEVQILKRQGKHDVQSQIMANIKRKCMKRMYLKLEKPPKEVEADFDYKADEEDPTDDEEYVFSLHSKEPETQGCETEIYVFKDIKMSDIHTFLIEKKLGIKKADGYHYNKYRTTIELLCDAIDELNAKID